MPTRWENFPYQKTIVELSHRPPWNQIFANFHPGACPHHADPYYKLLEENGFTPLEVSIKHTEWSFQSGQAFFDWVAGWNRQVTILDPKQRKQFQSDFLEIYLIHQPPREDGAIFWSLPYLEILAAWK